MTRVSKHPLKEKTFSKILLNLYSLIIELNSQEKVAFTLDVFLSKAEKIMLAKRLAIAILLEKGIDYRTISEEVKVSTSTVREVGFKLQSSGFRKIVKRLVEKLDENKEISWLEAILAAKTSVKARSRLYRG